MLKINKGLIRTRGIIMMKGGAIGNKDDNIVYGRTIINIKEYHSSDNLQQELDNKTQSKSNDTFNFFRTENKLKGIVKDKIEFKNKFNKDSSHPDNFTFPKGKSTITTSTITNFLSSVGQTSVQDSNKYFLVTCPNCHNDSTISSTKTFLKPDYGNYFCYSCLTKGNWEQFKNLTKENKLKQIKPSAVENNLGRKCNVELKDRKYLKINENKIIFDLLCGKNSPLTEKTLNDYWISVSMFEPNYEYKSNLKEELIPCAIFPRTTYISEGSNKFKIVGYKASTLPKSKFVTFEPKIKDEPGFFGYHLIPQECDEIALTPTEADAMSIYQATGIPAISLPKNIYQLPIEHMPLLSKFNKIYLWFDGDVQGQNAAQLFARKIGFQRSYVVKNQLEDIKVHSAYECLKKGYDLKQFIDNASLIKHDKVLDFQSIKDSILLEIMYADQVKGIPTTSFPSFNQIIKGFRPGELTIFSGPTGMGKTTFLSQLSLDYCNSGISTMWGSFEISNVRLAKKMLFQFAGKTIEDKVEYDHWCDKFQQLPLYFMKFFGSTKIQQVIEAMEHAVYAYDVQHILIDNLQFMTSGLGKGFERYEIQDDALSLLRNFATQYNVHITLVVHPKKDDREFLDSNSIFGSVKITQEADNVIILQNGPNDLRYIDVKKNRFDGTTGMVPVKFDKESFRSVELDAEEIKELNKMLKQYKG